MLSGPKSETATLSRWKKRGTFFQNKSYSQLPSAHHQIKELVWKSSDGGQQMHRICFWSNKMAREQGRLEGKKWVWLWVHVPLLPGGVSLSAECWASKAFFLAPRAGLLQQRLMVVLILLSHGSSVSPALLPYVAGQASKRAACLWCDITQWYAMRWEHVFLWIGSRDGETAACQTSWHGGL